MVHVYTGGGKGKTTAAIGMAIRMAGHHKKVLFAQFFKGSPTGEIRLLKKSQHITLIRCDKAYPFADDMTDAEKAAITKCHNDNLAYIISNMNDYDMIVLDEIFDACRYNTADEETVKRIVRTYGGELVMTGHEADDWYFGKADYASEIKKIKHPFDRGIDAREGIEY